MLYLDANVFLYPILYDDDKARAAARLLHKVEAGNQPAATSSLTVDEVIWVVQRYVDRAAGIRAGHALLAMRNLRRLSVTEGDLRGALALMESVAGLQPRDALHAAVATRNEIQTIVSDDDIFARIDGLKHEPLA